MPNHSPVDPAAREVQVSFAIDGKNDMIQFQAKERFAIKPSEVPVPFAVLELAYFQMLSVRLQKSGLLRAPSSPPTN